MNPNILRALNAVSAVTCVAMIGALVYANKVENEIAQFRRDFDRTKAEMQTWKITTL